MGWDNEYGYEDEDGSTYQWIWIISAIVAGFVLSWLFGGSSKYEGMTAKEWMDEYYWLSGCIKKNPYNAYEECL